MVSSVREPVSKNSFLTRTNRCLVLKRNYVPGQRDIVFPRDDSILLANTINSA